MAKNESDVKQLLVRRIEELEQQIQPMRDQIKGAEEEIRRARTALDALDGTLPARTTRAQEPRRGRRPTIDRDAIVSWVSAQNAPVRSGDIAEGVGFSVPSNVLTELVNEGRLKAEGERRGRVYTAK